MEVDPRVNILAGFCAATFFVADVVSLGIGIPMFFDPRYDPNPSAAAGVVCIVVGILSLIAFLVSLSYVRGIKSSTRWGIIAGNIICCAGLAGMIYRILSMGV